jgi:hypothetical protein
LWTIAGETNPVLGGEPFQSAQQSSLRDAPPLRLGKYLLETRSANAVRMSRDQRLDRIELGANDGLGDARHIVISS